MAVKISIAAKGAEPEWIELAQGVEVQFRPITTTRLNEIRRQPKIRKLKLEIEAQTKLSKKTQLSEAKRAEAALEAADLQEDIGIETAIAIAREGVIDWRGVEVADAEQGCTPEGVEALLGIFEIFVSFQEKIAIPLLTGADIEALEKKD